MHSLDKPIADIHEQESLVSLSNCRIVKEQINRKFISNISDALHQQKVSEGAATFPEHFNIDLTKFVTYFKPRGTSQRSNCILKWDPRADGQAQNICNIQNQNFLAMKKIWDLRVDRKCRQGRLRCWWKALVERREDWSPTSCANQPISALHRKSLHCVVHSEY